MFRTVLVSAVVLFAGVAFAGPKEDVVDAAKKAADSNYSWKTTTENANAQAGARGRMGPVDGKTEKGGYTVLTMTRGDNTTEVVIKGNKGAVKTADGWKSFEDIAADDQSPMRFMVRTYQNYKAPATQAEELAGKVKELTKADDAYTGELTEDGAKSLMTFGRGGGQGPEISGAKGTAKFWVKDGALSKYQVRVQGTIKFNDQERQIDRTTTTDIKDVGSTKIAVPDEAKKLVP